MKHYVSILGKFKEVANVVPDFRKINRKEISHLAATQRSLNRWRSVKTTTLEFKPLDQRFSNGYTFESSRKLQNKNKKAEAWTPCSEILISLGGQGTFKSCPGYFTIKAIIFLHLFQGFSTRRDFVPRIHLVTYGDTFGCHSWGSATGTHWVETRTLQ